MICKINGLQLFRWFSMTFSYHNQKANDRILQTFSKTSKPNNLKSKCKESCKSEVPHEGRKRHLQQPHFSKGLTKLAILPKGDLSAPYYRIIFELLDRLCQIIENPSFLLILQLSSFQSKIILWNDFWSSLNVILSQNLKKGHFLKKTAKKQKTNNNNFLLLQL